MPQFCRHNRLLQSCPICSREQAVDLRPVISSSAPRSTQPRPASRPGARERTRADRGRSSRAPAGVKVRRLRTAVDDGYRSPLVPGLKSSEEAARLADELAFAAGRLETLASDPPGLYAEVADPGADIEERTWLAFLVAYLGPLDDEDPFAAIRAVRTTWSSGTLPMLDGVATGPRAAYDPALGTGALTPTEPGPGAPEARQPRSRVGPNGWPSAGSPGPSSGSRFRGCTVTRASSYSSASGGSARTSSGPARSCSGAPTT